MDHPAAHAVSYRQMTRDGVKVYLVQYDDGEEEKEAWYNVQGKPFVSKAEKRSVEQERQKQQEENEARVREEAEAKAAEAPEKPAAHPSDKKVPNPKTPSN